MLFTLVLLLLLIALIGGVAVNPYLFLFVVLAFLVILYCGHRDHRL